MATSVWAPTDMRASTASLVFLIDSTSPPKNQGNFRDVSKFGDLEPSPNSAEQVLPKQNGGVSALVRVDFTVPYCARFWWEQACDRNDT